MFSIEPRGGRETEHVSGGPALRRHPLRHSAPAGKPRGGRDWSRHCFAALSSRHVSRAGRRVSSLRASRVASLDIGTRHYAVGTPRGTPA